MSDIKDIVLFSGISDESSSRFATAVRWRNYGADELIIDIGDESTDVLFVVSGAVRVIHRAETGKDVILGELGPGSYVGEMAAIDGMARSANVTTLQNSRIATMPAASFMDLLMREPEVCRAVLRLLVDRIRSLTRRISEHAYLTAKQRLFAELLRLSKPRPNHEGQRSVSPPPTHQVLAERIGSRREVVSRELSALEKEGLLEKTRGALVLVNPGELNSRISSGGLRVDLG